MSAKVSPSSFQLEGTFHSSGVLSATQCVRKMRGGSQPNLIQCDNGQYYIVKMTENPQGPNVLANEWLGGFLGKAAGLPVAEGDLVYLSDSFIDDDLGLWFETPTGRRRPKAGLHYGSRLVGEPYGGNRPMEYISRSRVEAITNREVFLGMYVMDVWANQQDNRQAILVADPDMLGFKAIFIDHGHMFGGPNWNFLERPGIACHMESSLYSELWHTDVVAGWISHFENVIPSALSLAISLVPLGWYNGDIGALQEDLLRRLEDLPRLVEFDAVALEQFTRRSTANDILRLPRNGIHMLGTAV
jgi:hypothetical protein